MGDTANISVNITDGMNTSSSVNEGVFITSNVQENTQVTANLIAGGNGIGVPEGGTTQQYLGKNSLNNHDTVFKTIPKEDVGLGNVDNTSDINKPVSSATQSVLDTKQPLDSTLTALASYSTPGLITLAETDTFVGRSISAGSAKVVVTNGSGVAGNPTIDLGSVASTDLSDSSSLYRPGGTDVAIADGGTGASSASTAINNLLPSQTNNTSKYLTTDGSSASWGIPSGAEFIDQWRKRPYLFSDFLVINNASFDPFSGIAINSGSINASNITSSTHHPGCARFRSSTTTNSGYSIGTGSGAMLLSGGEYFECVFNVATLANGTFYLGFHDAISVAEAVDGVYVVISSTGVLTGKTASLSTRSSTGTTYTVSAGTWYRLRVIVNNPSLVTYYLFDDSGTQLWSDTNTTNIPTSTGRDTGAGVVATNVGTTATDLLHLDYMALTWSSNLTR